MLKTPLFQQERAMSCGPASVRMALATLGISLSEEEIRNETNFLSLSGTLPWSLAMYLQDQVKSLGLEVVQETNVSLEFIKSQIADGMPVIVLWMTDAPNPHPTKNVFGTRYYPHYSVISAANDTGLTLQDPFGYETLWFWSEWLPLFQLEGGCCSEFPFSWLKSFGLMKPGTIITFILSRNENIN